MSDIDEINVKLGEVAKALDLERKVNEGLKADVEKGLISQGAMQEKMEKLDGITDKFEAQAEQLQKQDAAIQRMTHEAQSGADKEGVNLDAKAFSQGIKAMLKKGSCINSQNALTGYGEVEAKALSNAIATDGGFRVIPHRDSELTRILYDTSNLRSLARVVSIGTNRYEKVGKDVLGGAMHIGELESKAISTNSKTFMIEIPVHEIYSWQGVTEQHLEDAEYDVIGETTMDAAEEIKLGQNAAFITGNGVDRGRGIGTYDSKVGDADVYERGAIGTVDAAAVDAVTFDELIELQDALKMGYLPQASWLLSRKTRSMVRKLKYSSGTNEYIWELSTQAGTPAMMLGNPVGIMEDMPEMATGNVPIIFGDIRSSYTIVDRLGLSLLDDPYTGGNVRLLKYRSRYGSGITNYDSLKYLRMA